MAAILKIKRGLTSTTAPSLATGELGYSMGTGTSSNGGDRLYIGTGAETNGVAAAVVAIGGKYFTELLSQTPGILTASAAIIVDANKKIDELLVDNLSLNGNTLSTTDSNGDLILSPNGTGKVSIAGAFKLPRVDGTANQVLKTDGAGNVSWGTASSASVTSVDASGGTTGLTFTGGPITSSGTLTLSGTLAVGSGGTGVTTSTGSGSLVLSNSPSLVTPDLGTPSAAVLTNATNLPIATGISGLGTGVATALAINTGSAGAVLVDGGALGTPSSGTLTNATGLPVATGISGLGTNVASFLATPSSSNLAAALTTKTGTGSVVFGTSPTITTSLLTDSTSFDLFNTTATTVNFAGAATTLSIGAQTGTTTVNNNVVLKGTTTVHGAILPETDSTIDLGSSAKRFRTIYLKGSTIDLGGATMSGSAASGVTLTSINGTPIGDVTPSTGVFTTLSSTGNMTVGGNLTVNGTMTAINSTTVEVADKMLELGKTGSPTESTANGAGIQVTGTSAHNFLYNSTTTSWTSSEHLNLATGKVYAINGVSVLEATSLGSTVVGSSLTSVGTLTTGVWSATNIAMNKGGTGASLTAVNGGITYSTGSALAISAAGTSGQFLVSGGAGAPTWTDTIDGGTY